MWRKLSARLLEIVGAWRDYPLQPGAVFDGRYVIERCLGMGSYGQAYVCRDKETEGIVMLKRNKPSKGRLGIELLRRESLIMRELDHPQIPRWLGYCKRRRDEALIMQFIDGVNLEYCIYEQHEAYRVADALQIIKQLLQPLKHIHAAGYAHRDVRMPNVLVQGEMVYLVDLGLACRIGERFHEELSSALGEAGSAQRLDSATAIKRRMRAPAYSSDWFGMGHLFLFLMYADYEHPEGREERSWEEELALPSEVKLFIGKLLNDETAWAATEQCERELDEVIARLHNAPAQP